MGSLLRWLEAKGNTRTGRLDRGRDLTQRFFLEMPQLDVWELELSKLDKGLYALGQVGLWEDNETHHGDGTLKGCSETKLFEREKKVYLWPVEA